MTSNTPSKSVLKRFQPWYTVAGVIGLVFCILGAFLNREQFWRSYLLAYVFWSHLALGCLGVVMLHHLAGGRWSAAIRRLMESAAMTLSLMAILFVPLLFGLTTLYRWTSAQQVQQSELLQSKTIYLNIPFFVGRSVLYFAIWLGLAYLLNRWSLAYDRTGGPDLASRLRRLSALGLILYVLTVTFASFDWMMSLEPEWFSSIYGLSFLAGQALAALALAIIGLILLDKQNSTGGDRVQHLNDLGNLLLACVMVWAYFSFSQFLIIWSANIPEEAVWYVHRSQGGWLYVGLFLIAIHFAIPFVLLLWRRTKRTAKLLMMVAVLILIGRVVDLVWLVIPAWHPDGVYFHWLDLVVLIVMGLGWLWVFSLRWAERPSTPQPDTDLQ